MTVLLLVEEGKLGLDDDIRKLLPELPVYDPPVRVRHLLHHTGGLRDYQALRYLSGVPPEHVVPDEVFALIARQRGVDAPAGAKFDYDNTGYVLLRYLVERATGERFVDVVRERIFEPLGMSRTRWLEEFQTVVPNLATAYTGDATTGFRAAYSIPVAGSGGVVTTLADLARWDANFTANRLGKGDPALVARAVAPATLDDGTPLDYGAGLFLGAYQGRPIVWHAGHGPGYVADLVRFPAEKLSVFCLCNGTIDSRRLSRAVADLYLPARPAESAESGGAAKEPTPAAARPALPLDEAELVTILGSYLSDANDVWEFAREPSGLVLHRGEVRMELARTAPRVYRSVRPDWGWEFTFESPGSAEEHGAPSVKLVETGAGDWTYRRIPTPPAATALAPYLGRFDCDELRNPYTFVRKGDGLALETAVQPSGELLFLGADRFLLDGPFFTLIFQFERDAASAVTGFTLDAGSASGFRFERIAGR
jgi:hypothetical protein